MFVSDVFQQKSEAACMYRWFCSAEKKIYNSSGFLLKETSYQEIGPIVRKLIRWYVAKTQPTDIRKHDLEVNLWASVILKQRI